MAAGVAVFYAHEEVELVDSLTGARASVFDKRYLKSDCEIHYNVADNAAAAAGGYREQTVLVGEAVGLERLGDGADLVGFEYEYDSYLSGIPGRIITAQNARGIDMPFQYDHNVESEDGNNV